MLYKVTKNNLGNMQKVCIITIKRIDKSECICYIECVGVIAPCDKKRRVRPSSFVSIHIA